MKNVIYLLSLHTNVKHNRVADANDRVAVFFFFHVCVCVAFSRVNRQKMLKSDKARKTALFFGRIDCRCDRLNDLISSIYKKIQDN